MCRGSVHGCDDQSTPDMHDVLEDPLWHEAKLMLNGMMEFDKCFCSRYACVPCKYVSRSLGLMLLLVLPDFFNTRMTNTELGYMEVSD